MKNLNAQPTKKYEYFKTFVIGLSLLLSPIVYAGESFTINTTMAYSTGSYIYDAPIRDYVMYMGASYSKNRFSISASLPMVIQRDNRTAPDNSAGQTTTMSDPAYTAGISDLYLYSEYEFYQGENYFPRIFITGQIKIPTSSGSGLFSSGKFDYGIGLAFRKMYGTYKVFGDVGYLALGDPQGLDYTNPVSYGIGIGKHASHGRSSVTFYYQEYSAIINGLTPPRQLTAGYYRAITDVLGISFYGSRGFGESSPEYTFAVGFDLKI